MENMKEYQEALDQLMTAAIEFARSEDVTQASNGLRELAEAAAEYATSCCDLPGSEEH